MKHSAMELYAAYSRQMLALIERRLGKEEQLSVPDVAAACNCSCALVHEWVEAGDVHAWSISPAGAARKHVRISRQSVLDFYRKRMALKDKQQEAMQR